MSDLSQSEREVLGGVGTNLDHDLDAAAMRTRVRSRLHERDARSGRGRLLAVGTAVVVLFGGGTIAAAAVLTDNGPARDEISSFATDAGISPATAQKRLMQQKAIPVLIERGREALGDRFGGVWVDRSGTVHLATTDDASRQTAQRVVDSIDPDGAVELEVHRFSERELVDVQRQIERGAQEANADAATPIEVETDVTNDRVVVLAPVSSDRTAAQRTLIDQVQQRHGALVQISRAPGPLDRLPAK